MAEALEVVVKGEGGIVGYACPTCRLFSSPYIYACGGERAKEAAREAAERCCDRVCTRCDAKLPTRLDETVLPRPWPYTICPSCKTADDEAKKAKWFANATKIEEADYDGGIFVDDDYYASVDDLRDSVDNDDLPEWGYADNSYGLSLPSARSLIESALEDHHEDACEELADGAEEALDAALKAWTEQYASGVKSVEADLNRVVLIQKDEETSDERKTGTTSTERSDSETNPGDGGQVGGNPSERGLGEG